jgi:hypothetical protein
MRLTEQCSAKKAAHRFFWERSLKTEYNRGQLCGTAVVERARYGHSNAFSGAAKYETNPTTALFSMRVLFSPGCDELYRQTGPKVLLHLVPPDYRRKNRRSGPSWAVGSWACSSPKRNTTKRIFDRLRAGVWLPVLHDREGPCAVRAAQTGDVSMPTHARGKADRLRQSLGRGGLTGVECTAHYLLMRWRTANA